MFETRTLRRALIDNDIDAIRALVAKHGASLLDKRLPLRFSREDGKRQAGDEWLKKVFSSPTPIGFALLLERDDLVRTLVELGATPLHKVDSNYPNMLFVAAAFGRTAILQEWLETYRAAARQLNGDADTLLHIACQHRQPAVTRLLLAHGFYTEAKSDSGRSPLLYAEQAGDLDSVRLLHAAARGELPAKTARTDELVLRRAQRTGPVPHVVQLIEQPRAPADDWHLIDAARVARVTDVPAIGYRLTEIFNFSTGEVLRLNRNLETGAETAAVSRFADLTDHDIVAQAAQRLGRSFDPPRAGNGTLTLKKPK